MAGDARYLLDHFHPSPGLYGTYPARCGLREVPAWHLTELVQRHEDAEARPGVGQPWRDVLAPLEAGS